MKIKTIPGLDHVPGSKDVNGTIQTILNLIPPHKIYYELFLGKGTVILYKKPAGLTVGIDIDPVIIKSWENARPFDMILKCSDAMSEIVSLWAADQGTFIYCDPPYPKGSRKSQKDIYNFEMTDFQHELFLTLIVKVKANCMISTYPNDLYEKALGSWHKIKFESQTRQGKATEVLYMNYPEPTELHDYSYLGDGCWERQRIKRKIIRKIAKFRKVPVLERKAIILALNREFLIDTSKI